MVVRISGVAISDDGLLAGMAAGDPQAAAEFVRRYQARVFGLVLAIVGVPAVAEEVAQEAYGWADGTTGSAFVPDEARPTVATVGSGGGCQARAVTGAGAPSGADRRQRHGTAACGRPRCGRGLPRG
jgi:hypothetical protein